MCKYCRKNNAIISGVMQLALLAATKGVRFMGGGGGGGSDVHLLAYFSTLKPELGFIL